MRTRSNSNLTFEIHLSITCHHVLLTARGDTDIYVNDEASGLKIIFGVHMRRSKKSLKVKSPFKVDWDLTSSEPHWSSLKLILSIHTCPNKLRSLSKQTWVFMERCVVNGLMTELWQSRAATRKGPNKTFYSWNSLPSDKMFSFRKHKVNLWQKCHLELRVPDVISMLYSIFLCCPEIN